MKTDSKIIVIFVIFGIFILAFGLSSIKNTIEKPFYIPKSETRITEKELHQVLAQKDTDNDGLSDEDEVFKYHTSIYLDDSDSDGYNDKEEVDAGSDPLSPESTPLKKVAERKQENVISVENRREPTVEKIKEILIQLGVPKEDLDKIDEEVLKKLYQETVKETGVNPQNLPLQNLNQVNLSEIQREQNISQVSNQVDLTTLNAQQIRKLFLAAGVDEQTLNSIDDETLKTIFLKALVEMSSLK